jgi:hypothetical protein
MIEAEDKARELVYEQCRLLNSVLANQDLSEKLAPEIVNIHIQEILNLLNDLSVKTKSDKHKQFVSDTEIFYKDVLKFIDKV